LGIAFRQPKKQSELARKNHGKSRSDERIAEWVLTISAAELSSERTAREKLRAANHRLVQLMLF
jgi:hypothetical protein